VKTLSLKDYLCLTGPNEETFVLPTCLLPETF